MLVHVGTRQVTFYDANIAGIGPGHTYQHIVSYDLSPSNLCSVRGHDPLNIGQVQTQFSVKVSALNKEVAFVAVVFRPTTRAGSDEGHHSLCSDLVPVNRDLPESLYSRIFHPYIRIKALGDRKSTRLNSSH